MKLSNLVAKPQLIKVELTDEETIKEFGEPLEFYTYDRQPLDVFMKLANSTDNQGSQIIEIVRTLILDEKGEQVLKDNDMLPTGVLIKTITKVTEMLGK
jgi:hypothetical protein